MEHVKELREVVREFMARLALDSEDECWDVCERLGIDDTSSLYELSQRANAILNATEQLEI